MGDVFDSINEKLAAWLGAQRMFFVASAPLAAEGHVNCSPKGLDTFRVLGPREVAYLDLTGSGAETVAHLRENGRIVLMFCAFEGAPKIVRLHGVGEVVTAGAPDFAALRARFGEHPGVRSVIRVRLTRIGDSCGYGVPRYQLAGERDTLPRWTLAKTPAELLDYRDRKNGRSLDGLPGMAPGEGAEGPI